MINEYGKIIPKWWLTHDMSFNVVKLTNWSVNHWVLWGADIVPLQHSYPLTHPLHCTSPLMPPDIMNPTDKDGLQGSLQMPALWPQDDSASHHFDRNLSFDGLMNDLRQCTNPSQWSNVSKLATNLAKLVPWMTLWGTLCCKTQMPHQMDSIASGGLWVVEGLPRQPQLANFPSTIMDRKIWCLWKWNWWILCHHRHSMEMKNPTGHTKPRNTECTGILGEISFHMDGHRCG